MNEIARIMLPRWLKYPLENWSKLVAVAAEINAGRTTIDTTTELYKLDLNLYDEVRQSPEKLQFFRHNKINLKDVMWSIDLSINYYRNDQPCQRLYRGHPSDPYYGLRSDSVITLRTVLSYLALKRYGFCVSRELNIAERMVVLGVLRPKDLYPVLTSAVGPVEKLAEVNRLIAGRLVTSRFGREPWVEPDPDFRDPGLEDNSIQLTG